MSSVNTSADIAPDRSGETAWLTLFAGFVLSSGLLVAAGDNIGQQILAMFVLMVASGLAVRFDIAHPLVWFAGAFTLYSISGPLLQYLGVHPYDTWGGYRIQELDFSGAMDFQFLALLVAVMVIGPYRQSFAGAMKHRDAITLFDGAMPVLISATVIGIANVYQIVSQDFGSKGDVVLSGDWTTRLSFAFNIAATALGVYLAKLFCEGRPVSAYVTLTIVIAVGIAMVLLIGQRHFLFRAGLICLLVFHIFHQRISIR